MNRWPRGFEETLTQADRGNADRALLVAASDRRKPAFHTAPNMQRGSSVGEAVMFDHILVPTDFSGDADEAVSIAVAIAQKFDSRITLVHVVTPLTLMYEDLPSMDFVTSIEEAARAALVKALESLRAKWPSADSLFLRGATVQEILGAIDAQKADLVVMGKHGRGVLNRMLVGSTAERVVRHSSVPVLTVKKR